MTLSGRKKGHFLKAIFSSRKGCLKIKKIVRWHILDGVSVSHGHDVNCALVLAIWRNTGLGMLLFLIGVAGAVYGLHENA